MDVRTSLDQASSRRAPLLVKIVPDLADQDIDAVADLALELKLDGIIDSLLLLRFRSDATFQGGLQEVAVQEPTYSLNLVLELVGSLVLA